MPLRFWLNSKLQRLAVLPFGDHETLARVYSGSETAVAGYQGFDARMLFHTSKCFIRVADAGSRLLP